MKNYIATNHKYFGKLNRLFLIILLSAFLHASYGQVHYVVQGDMKIGIRISKEGKTLPIESLCESLDPVTGIPRNLVIPDRSVLGIELDSLMKRAGILFIDNGKTEGYMDDMETLMSGFSRSSSPGSEHTFTFIDENRMDTLEIAWKVGYDKVELLDVYPADRFEESVAFQFGNLFEEYPSNSQFDWGGQPYIDAVDDRGIPINPQIPYDHNGLYFILGLRSNDMQVQLRGLQDSPRSFDPDNPYDIFLFKDLPPGSYELIAWPYPDAPEEITLRYGFTILPPWWLGPWAIIGFTFGVTAALAGAIFGMYRVNHRRKTRELAWQQKITDAELKAIRAQLNPHFLFNTLSSIQNLVSTGLNEKANDYIIKLSRLLRIVLSSSDNQFHDLEQEFDILRLYLELEKLRYGFTYSIEVDPEVDNNTLIPAMILQPYVENAVKHGVAGLGDKGEITVRAGIKNYALLIEILDNGPGMSKPEKDSAGLKLGDERLRSLNELYSADARVKIVDRADQNGVRVVLTLPLNNEI